MIRGATAQEDARAPSEDPEAGDRKLVERLRRGDGVAFDELVLRLSPALQRVARSHVPSAAVAEEVVQETWLAVIEGIDRFEGRSSVRTWIFRILLNRAATRGARERRNVSFADLANSELEADHAAVDPGRFLSADDVRAPLHWATPPRRWSESPEQAAEDAETLAVVREATDALPRVQRLVVTLRDVEGWSAEEVCDLVGLSTGNQRVLLHRGRTRVRAALERHLAR